MTTNLSSATNQGIHVSLTLPVKMKLQIFVLFFLSFISTSYESPMHMKPPIHRAVCDNPEFLILPETGWCYAPNTKVSNVNSSTGCPIKHVCYRVHAKKEKSLLLQGLETLESASKISVTN